MLIYVGEAKVSWNFGIDLTHEFLLLIQAGLMPCYTEFVPDPNTRHQIGWVSSTFFCL